MINREKQFSKFILYTGIYYFSRYSTPGGVGKKGEKVEKKRDVKKRKLDEFPCVKRSMAPVASGSGEVYKPESVSV